MFLKTALLNLIRQHWQKQARMKRERPGLDVQAVASVDCETDDAFAESWREELITRSWEALAHAESLGGPPFHAALKLKADIPGIRSVELADRLNSQLQPTEPWSATSIRKVIQRARYRFAELLLNEVAKSLEDPSLIDLEDELIETGLLPYCRSALESRRGNS